MALTLTLMSAARRRRRQRRRRCVEHAVSNMHCRACIVEHAVLYLQCRTCSVELAVSNMQCGFRDLRPEVQDPARYPSVRCFVFVALFCLVPVFVGCACPVADSRPLACAQRRQRCMEWLPLVVGVVLPPPPPARWLFCFVLLFVVCFWWSLRVGQSEELCKAALLCLRVFCTLRRVLHPVSLSQLPLLLYYYDC